MISRPTILVYHAVGPIRSADDSRRGALPADVFAKQMRFLKQHRRVVPLSEIVDDQYERGRARVAITFDDGYRCLLEHALPILREYEFPATLFVPTGAIGGCNTWDHESPPAGLEVMSTKEIRDVDASGFTIESHGHGHIDLAEATAASVREDLTRSVGILKNLLGCAPRFLAYPWGQVTTDVEEMVREAGFGAAFTIGVRDRGRFARARIPVRNMNPAWLFRIQTSGYWPALRFSRIISPIRVVGKAFVTVRRSRSGSSASSVLAASGAEGPHDEGGDDG